MKRNQANWWCAGGTECEEEGIRVYYLLEESEA